MAMYTIRSPKDLGRVIADRRNSSGLTQAELAKTAAVSRSYLSQIEAGRSSSVMDHSFRLLRRLGATITISFDDTTEADD